MNPPTNLQDLQELKTYLLEGVGTVKPHATKCLEGTRTSILTDVDVKTNDCGGANIIHIYGAPGSGKSSISLTAKSRLHRQRRLVTHFRFDRNESATTTPTSLWCHVAYDLARLFPSVLSHILQQLRNDEVELDSPMDIFTAFIEDSLLNVISLVDRPSVVIIDALDECGGLVGELSPDRQILLQTLRRWAKLPKHFKLLVTSRPEGDITRVLSSISTPIEIPSGYVVTENPQAKYSIDSSNDIRMFLEERFQFTRQSFSSLPADWPGSVIISAMVRRAAGIFIWATTAANFIHSGIDPRGRLRKIMDDASDPSSMEPLYSLYAIVLDMAFGKIGSGGAEAEILRFVLGTMVLAKRPLDDNEYTKLPTTESITQDMLSSIRNRLCSVISSGSLRFVHKSFDDFLLSEKCPSKYRISRHDTYHLLTNLCLNTMNEGLRFNICGLETSCLKNADVPDIAAKVANGISPLLSYSCLFFADHLALTPFHEYLLGRVQDVMLDKLLFWFEAMSLLKEINRVPPSLLLILKWLHKSPCDKFKVLLHDARQFVRAFGRPIAQSAPHLYISALPFSPENSPIAKYFLPYFPWILALSTGKPANWPSCIFTSEHHRSGVTCIAFSVDEEYFATGSYDKTICIFDSETGNLISGPFECGGWVYSVSFDPNDRHVWAGRKDGEVSCWDIRTGDKHLVIRTQTSHRFAHHSHFNCYFSGSRKVISAGKSITLWNGETGRCEHNCDWMDEGYKEYMGTSISPDGCYIALVTGQRGTTIKIWEVVNGSEIQGPVDSHPQFEHSLRISALSFSVDSKFAVSGSKDGTVLIWDASTGDTTGPLLSTGAGYVTAVAYSPKNHLLAAVFGTVTIWDALTHELLGRLEGHTVGVSDITLSRDGQRVLTASYDGTVRMWDLSRRGDVLGTNVNQTQTSSVVAVAFSWCGRKLVSLDDHSIQGWDADTGKSLFKCETRARHRELIFSPDGSQVVAFNDEGEINMWNVNTGTPVSKLKMDIQIIHIAFRSADGMLIVCCYPGVVNIWSAENSVPQMIARLPKIIALSPDGLTVIVRDDRRSPRHYLWSTTTQTPLPLVLADNEYVSASAAAYSPSGRSFASLLESDQGGVMLLIWNLQTGELAARFSTTDQIYSLAFSPDDRHIASGSRGQIWIFDSCTGQLSSGPWIGHTDNILTLAFSPDGKSLASGSRDRQVRVWNVANMSKNSQLSLSNWGAGTRMEDGWVKDVGGKLLFWVPKDHRARFVWHHSVPLGESETTTQLDLSRFRYGESWMECYSGGDSSRAVD